MTTAVPMAPLGSARTFLRFIGDEWHGEGRFFGRGAFGETIWGGVASLGFGIGFLVAPGRIMTSTWQAVAQMYAKELPWLDAPSVMGVTLMTGSLLTLLGMVLFYMRGRCFWSRVCRMGGATIGFAVWLTVFMGALSAFVHSGGSFGAVIINGCICVTMARSTSLAWARF